MTKIIINGCENCPFATNVYDASAKEVDEGWEYCSFYKKHNVIPADEEAESAFDDCEAIWEAICEELSEGEANDWYENAFDENEYSKNWRPPWCKVNKVDVEEIKDGTKIG